MKRITIYLLVSVLYSCQDTYKIIDNQELKKFTIQDTLVNNNKILVLKIGDSISDSYSRILLKSYRSKTDNYLFNSDCKLENDSTIFSYYPAFIIDEDGEFKKNGVWLYAKFITKGSFPFQSKEIRYSVDSIPRGWNKKLPIQEGIYYYRNSSLLLLSSEQSEEKFKAKEMDGFYFIPNKGRLFDRINLNQFE